MAIYKNREVNVVPTTSHELPSNIHVTYRDGTHETVSLGQVHFTKEEKDFLKKNYPSKYEGVSEATEDDLKAVRLGITPPSDPSLKERAEEQARRDRQREETEKQMKTAKEQADKDLDKEVQTQPVQPVNSPEPRVDTRNQPQNNQNNQNQKQDKK